MMLGQREGIMKSEDYVAECADTEAAVNRAIHMASRRRWL